MTTTDPRAAAIEAAARAAYIAYNLDHQGAAAAWDDMGGSEPFEERAEWEVAATAAVAAAVPHLTAGLRALHRRDSSESVGDEWCAECGDDWPCSTTQALDALEAGATSEGWAR